MKSTLKKLATLFPHADKVMHFLAGAVIALVVLLVTGVEWYGMSAAFAAGLYKEYSDHVKLDTGISKKYAISSYLDWFATILGGVAIELLM